MKTLKFLSILLILLLLGSCAAPNYLPFYQPKKHKKNGRAETQSTPRDNSENSFAFFASLRDKIQPVRQIG
jgi:hypothetical protein